MKPKILIPILIVGVVAAFLWYRAQSNEEPDKRQLYGNVDIREVDLAFRQPGRLSRMLVDEGDVVKKGDTLAELDDQPFQDALAVATAELRRAQAERDKLRSGYRPQEVRGAEIAVTRAQAVLERASQDLERQKQLNQAGASSTKTLELAKLAHTEATTALASAQQTLSLQHEGFRSEDLAAASARVSAAEATITQMKTALSDTRLIASADGLILSRVREPGSMVSNRDPVYVLSLRDPLYVRAYVSEAELAQVTPATKVAIHIDGSSKTYHGKVGFISPRAEFTPKSVETAELRTNLVYRVRIIVLDGDTSLHQGMPVTIELGEAATQTAAL